MCAQLCHQVAFLAISSSLLTPVGGKAEPLGDGDVATKPSALDVVPLNLHGELDQWSNETAESEAGQ
jgi:hypothetical protein